MVSCSLSRMQGTRNFFLFFWRVLIYTSAVRTSRNHPWTAELQERPLIWAAIFSSFFACVVCILWTCRLHALLQRGSLFTAFLSHSPQVQYSQTWSYAPCCYKWDVWFTWWTVPFDAMWQGALSWPGTLGTSYGMPRLWGLITLSWVVDWWWPMEHPSASKEYRLQTMKKLGQCSFPQEVAPDQCLRGILQLKAVA